MFLAGLTWYRRAAAQELTKAQYNIGLDYDAGLGVPSDIDQARLGTKKAAAAGERDAKTWLDERTLYEAAGAGDVPPLPR